MDLRRLLVFLRRWAWLLLAGALLAGGAAYAVFTFSAPPSAYRSTAVLLVGPALSAADANPAQLDASRRVSAIYVQVGSSRPLLQRVIDELALDISVDPLRNQLEITTPEDPPIITVTAEAGDPQLAAELANELVRQLIAVSPAQADEGEQTNAFIERQIDALEEEIESLVADVERLSGVASRTDAQDEQLASLQDRLANLRGTYAALVAASSSTASTLLTVIEPAVPNEEPLPRSPLQVTIFAALIGLVLAAGIAVLMDHLDDSVKSDDDVSGASGFDNLAEIPAIPRPVRRDPGLTAHLERYQPISESFHSLRTSLELSAPQPVRSLLVTSAMRGEGKTTVAAILAVVFAQSGRKVLLVDADLRRPALHQWFGLDNVHGLSDLLHAPQVEVWQHVRPTSIANLRILTAGMPAIDPAGLVGSATMRELIGGLRSEVDLLIVDSPSMLSAAETAVLAASLEWTLVVVAAGRTAQGSLTEIADDLGRAKANVIGTALNRVPLSRARERMKAYPAVRSPERAEPALHEDRSGL